jgi:hypothetical protein
VGSACLMPGAGQSPAVAQPNSVKVQMQMLGCTRLTPEKLCPVVCTLRRPKQARALALLSLFFYLSLHVSLLPPSLTFSLLRTPEAEAAADGGVCMPAASLALGAATLEGRQVEGTGRPQISYRKLLIIKSQTSRYKIYYHMLNTPIINLCLSSSLSQ